MPTKVINVSRVNYLVGQVLNGGFLQFVTNSQWNRSFVDGVRSGLAGIGAIEHLAVFEGGARLINEAYEKDGGKLLDTDRFAMTLAQLEREHLSNSKLSGRLSRSVDDSWRWGDRWQCAQILSARYIAEWRGVRRVPAAAYPAALDGLAASIPDLATRRQMREDARPWEKKAIDRLVAQVFLSDIWYTGFSTREHNGRKVWCWNFTVGKTPGQGHHQALFIDGEAIMSRETPTRSSRGGPHQSVLRGAASPAMSRSWSRERKAPTSLSALRTPEITKPAARNYAVPASLPTLERSSFRIGELFALW